MLSTRTSVLQALACGRQALLALSALQTTSTDSTLAFDRIRMAPIAQQDRLTALRDLLARAEAHALTFLESLDSRPVMPGGAWTICARRLADPSARRRGRGRVIDLIGREGHLASMASAGPRFFGFVIGGSLPVALAADWLTSAWDQNTGLYVAAPAASVMEETAARWLVELFGLPRSRAWGSSPAGRWRTSRASLPRATRCCARPDGTSRRRDSSGAPPSTSS